MEYSFTNCAQLLNLCQSQNGTMGEIMLSRERELFKADPERTIAKMAATFEVMQKAVATSLAGAATNDSARQTGGAVRFADFARQRFDLCGELITNAITYAIGTIETAAAMGQIVPTPSASSAGVLPAVLLSLQNGYNLSRQDILHSLFTASAIGYVINCANSDLNEIATASGMSAAAAVQLMGGSTEQVSHAAAAAISTLAPLNCNDDEQNDTCAVQNRNVLGATNAIICAQMAMSGTIPTLNLDEVLAQRQQAVAR